MKSRLFFWAITLKFKVLSICEKLGSAMRWMLAIGIARLLLRADWQRAKRLSRNEHLDQVFLWAVGLPVSLAGLLHWIWTLRMMI